MGGHFLLSEVPLYRAVAPMLSRGGLVLASLALPHSTRSHDTLVFIYGKLPRLENLDQKSGPSRHARDLPCPYSLICRLRLYSDGRVAFQRLAVVTKIWPTWLCLQLSPRPSRTVHDHPHDPHFQLKHPRPPSEPRVVPHRKRHRPLRVLHPVAAPRQGTALTF